MSRAQFLRRALVSLSPFVLAAGAVLSGAVETRGAAWDGEQGDGTASDEILLNQYAWAGPLECVPGSLGLRFLAPGYDPLEFHEEVTDLAGFPGGLTFADSPFGAGALLLETNPGAPEYLLLLPEVGAVLPLSWDSDLGGYSGAAGALLYEVTQDPVPNVGLPHVTFGDDPDDGERVIDIEAGADAFFIQFFTLKVTWEGVDANGNPTSGPQPGNPIPPMPWFGNNIDCNGNTVYVDSTRPDGNYGGVTGTRNAGQANATTFMRDSPRCNDPAAVAQVIQAQAVNQGVRVTKITVEYHMTTYIGAHTPMGDVITHKYEWSRTIVYVFDECGMPYPVTGPNGGYGTRPGSAGTPTPASGFDPQHISSMALYLLAGVNSGASTGSGW